ncbi:MAG: undecaprenyldiphospho-muramoylpentapeptide beta-N-acetylglucosaminyltransferase [Coriobacteriia bacterium]|nr:undecaprenyldiphospho-muramoylpentapeptide beta-N-acetylglucosaminyltransferase [Coriobacteriia bacterium]
MRVLVSGGGTAGHIYPALTVAEHARDEEHSEVTFVGVPESLESRLASEAGVEFIGVPARGWDRARPLTLLSAGLTTAVSFVRCLRLLRTRRVDVVIGFGGYVSLPLGLAAAMGSIPLVLHEQNAVAGIANRVLSRWATTVCVTYAESISRLALPGRALVTGNPVRTSFAAADRAAGRKTLGAKKNDIVLLVFGGSRGARHLNTALIGLHPRLKAIKRLRVVQIAGRDEVEQVREALAAAAGGKAPSWWSVLDYVEAMGDAMAAADLVVCRSGATSIAELASVGRPAILIPYPFATDDHQSHNASPLVDAGAAVVFSDSALDSESFGDELIRILDDPERRASMAECASRLARPLAAHAVVDAALEAAASGSPWRHRERRDAIISARDDDAGEHIEKGSDAPVQVEAEAEVDVETSIESNEVKDDAGVSS